MASNFILLCYLGISIFLARTAAHEAIVNGFRAEIDQFPYQISVQNSHGQQFCGGGIIHAQFILTAAHCFIAEGINFKNGAFYVLAGTNDLDKRGRPAVAVAIEKIFVPIEYKRKYRFGGDDIAVAKLKHPLELSRHINKLELPKHKNQTFFDKTAVIAGFGWQWIIRKKDNDIIGGRNDSQLRFAKADVRKHLPVLTLFKMTVPEDYVYAKVKQADLSKPSGVCRGDSGSPLVYDNTVIGVSNNGPRKCTELKRGGFYASVAHYLDFIHIAMQDKPHKDVRTHVVLHEAT